MNIKRSEGMVAIKGLPFIVGGGYQGKTEELDNLVANAAEILSKLFNRDVEIRFNSDRKSGGAWLINSLKGFEGNCQVGLNAGYRAIRPDGMSATDFFKQCDNLPQQLYINTYVSVTALKNPALANSYYNQKCDTYHDTLRDAEKWLGENIDTSKILK